MTIERRLRLLEKTLGSPRGIEGLSDEELDNLMMEACRQIPADILDESLIADLKLERGTADLTCHGIFYPKSGALYAAALDRAGIPYFGLQQRPSSSN